MHCLHEFGSEFVFCLLAISRPASRPLCFASVDANGPIQRPREGFIIGRCRIGAQIGPIVVASGRFGDQLRRWI